MRSHSRCQRRIYHVVLYACAFVAVTSDQSESSSSCACVACAVDADEAACSLSLAVLKISGRDRPFLIRLAGKFFRFLRLFDAGLFAGLEACRASL